jgi:hypothetical protein
MEKHEKKRWRGGAIYLREDGTIEKVVDSHGKEIKGEKEMEKRTRGKESQPVVLVSGDPEERCVYSASGNCYCT